MPYLQRVEVLRPLKPAQDFINEPGLSGKACFGLSDGSSIYSQNPTASVTGFKMALETMIKFFP